MKHPLQLFPPRASLISQGKITQEQSPPVAVTVFVSFPVTLPPEAKPNVVELSTFRIHGPPAQPKSTCSALDIIACRVFPVRAYTIGLH